MTTEHLRFAPDILARLGEELVPSPAQGLVELVRNSFDADALTCTVELIDTHRPGGTIRLVDDGKGMDADAIRNGWLILGKSSKEPNKPTDIGRLPVGDKGLGRLAALRMGEEAVLETRPGTEPGSEYRLTLDWARFDSADVVEDVQLAITRHPTNVGQGTVIAIRNLKSPLRRREVTDLSRALLLLADPFDDKFGFRPTLVAPEFKELEKRVRDSYFDQAEFRLTASVGNGGLAEASVLDWRGNELWSAKHSELSESAKPYESVAAAFDVWVYILDAKSFSSRSSTVGEVREWLKLLGGVHLYYRGLRVQPYGDPGHDWLDMNLQRARSPELRPSTNTSMGKVSVVDPDGVLLQKTDRAGFIETEAFGELRRFCIDALDWMARRRLRDREESRQKAKKDTSRSITRAKVSVARAIERMSPGEKPAVERAFSQLERAREREAKTFMDELQLYRTLATVGTTAAVFAHESSKPVTQIIKMARALERRGEKALGARAYDASLAQPVRVIARSAEALRSFAALPLSLLKSDKRRLGRVDVHAAISGMQELFAPFMSDAMIEINLELFDGSPYVIGNVAAIEAIVANLLTNATNAFSSADL